MKKFIFPINLGAAFPFLLITVIYTVPFTPTISKYIWTDSIQLDLQIVNPEQEITSIIIPDDGTLGTEGGTGGSDSGSTGGSDGDSTGGSDGGSTDGSDSGSTGGSDSGSTGDSDSGSTGGSDSGSTGGSDSGGTSSSGSSSEA